MALSSLLSASSKQYVCPVFSCCTKSSSNVVKVDHHKFGSYVSRRVGAIAVMTSLLLTTEAVISDKTAYSFDFRMTVPDQTAEEALSMIRDHAQALLDVKSLIESDLWREAQRELRKNSAYLKQDIYTIIQSKEGSIRPLLRKLYAKLFNNVTKLDYAARDQDLARVQEYYNEVATALNDILSRL